MFQCLLAVASHRSSVSGLPTGKTVNRLTTRYPPSWSPYSSSTVHSSRASMAFRASSYPACPVSRNAPCQNPTSPTGMYRSRFCRWNSSSGAC